MYAVRHSCYEQAQLQYSSATAVVSMHMPEMSGGVLLSACHAYTSEQHLICQQSVLGSLHKYVHKYAQICA